MTNLSRLYAETESRISRLLDDARLPVTTAETEEVASFLRAGEYGLALETLACVLVEETKPIEVEMLHAIDDVARAMHLRDEPYMRDLHNLYDRQHRVSA